MSGNLLPTTRSRAILPQRAVLKPDPQDASLTGQPARRNSSKPAQYQPARWVLPPRARTQPQQPAGHRFRQGRAYPECSAPVSPAQAVYAPTAPNPFVTALRRAEAGMRSWRSATGKPGLRPAWPPPGLWG